MHNVLQVGHLGHGKGKHLSAGCWLRMSQLAYTSRSVHASEWLDKGRKCPELQVREGYQWRMGRCLYIADCHTIARAQRWAKTCEPGPKAGACVYMRSCRNSCITLDPYTVCACSVMSNSLWPMDCSPPGSSVHGISPARMLEWVAISSSRGSSQTKDRICISYIDR